MLEKRWIGGSEALKSCTRIEASPSPKRAHTGGGQGGPIADPHNQIATSKPFFIGSVAFTPDIRESLIEKRLVARAHWQ